MLGLVGIVVLMAVNAAVSYRNIWQLNENSRWVVHTHEVMDALSEGRAQLHEAAAVQRAFVLVGGDRMPPAFAQHVEAGAVSVVSVK